MVGNHYPTGESSEHFNEYREFSQKVANLQQDLRQGKLVTREGLLAFLNGWLVSHILKTDKKLGVFLNKESFCQ